jgi:hypothetical protein
MINWVMIYFQKKFFYTVFGNRYLRENRQVQRLPDDAPEEMPMSLENIEEC